MGQPRGRARSSRWPRSWRALPRPRRARARRRGAGGRPRARSPSTSSAPTCCRSAPTSSAGRRASARCSCAGGCACAPLLRRRRPGAGPPGRARERARPRRAWARRAQALADRRPAADRARRRPGARPTACWPAVAALDGVRVYGDPDDRLPHLVCLGVDGIEPQAVLLGPRPGRHRRPLGQRLLLRGPRALARCSRPWASTPTARCASRSGWSTHRRRRRRPARRPRPGHRPPARPRGQRMNDPAGAGRSAGLAVADPWFVCRPGHAGHHPGHRAPRAPATCGATCGSSRGATATWWSIPRWGWRRCGPWWSASLGGPLLAVATHAHGDHVGGLAEFDERAIHRAEADVVASDGVTVGRAPPTSVPRCEPYRGGRLPVRRAADRRPPPGRVRAAERSRSRRRRPPACWTRVTSSTWATGRFEVLHLPGHSPGSIGLWDRRHRRAVLGRRALRRPAARPARRLRHRRLRPRPWSGCAGSRSTSVHGGHEASFGRERLVALCDAYLAGTPFTR